MFKNYSGAVVTKLVIEDGKAKLQKFTFSGNVDTFVGEIVIGEVK